MSTKEMMVTTASGAHCVLLVSQKPNSTQGLLSKTCWSHRCLTSNTKLSIVYRRLTYEKSTKLPSTLAPNQGLISTQRPN